MVMFMNMVIMMLALVWIGVGILTIGLGLIYYKVSKPMLRQMHVMYSGYSDEDEA